VCHPPPARTRARAHPGTHTRHSITLRKSKYDLGKKFFTNITPGYQLYPAVFLMPWTDPAAPGDFFLFMYTCRTGQVVRFTSGGEFLPMWNMCVAPGALVRGGVLMVCVRGRAGAAAGLPIVRDGARAAVACLRDPLHASPPPPP
jgi:hypothetical protein